MFDQFEKFPDNPYVWHVQTDKPVNMLDENGNLNVAVGDQITRPLDLHFQKPVGSTLLASDVSLDDKVIPVVSATGIAAGQILSIVEAATFPIKASQMEAVSVLSNNVTVDRPIDNSYSAGSKIVFSTEEMAVNGAVATQIFTIRGFDIEPPLQAKFDITKIHLQIICADPPAYDEFGDISGGLLNGIVMRRVDGTNQNYWNFKTNASFVLHSFHTEFFTASHPLAVNGLTMMYVFAGQQNHGVAVRVAAGENLELLVQDDLSSLISFKAVAHGHVVN